MYLDNVSSELSHLFPNLSHSSNVMKADSVGLSTIIELLMLILVFEGSTAAEIQTDKPAVSTGNAEHRETYKSDNKKW